MKDDGTPEVGDKVAIDLTWGWFAACVECGDRWIVIACEPFCTECQIPGILGERVRFEDLGSGPPLQ